MDYSFLTMKIVFSGDRITGNYCRGVCKISREWRVTVEHVLRIATIYSSYTSIFLPFPRLHITPSFSTSYATFDDIRVFWWQKQDALEVCEASVSEEGGVGIPKLSLFPSLHFLVFLLLYLLAVKLGECKAKEFLPPKKTHIGIANKRCKTRWGRKTNCKKAVWKSHMQGLVRDLGLSTAFSLKMQVRAWCIKVSASNLVRNVLRSHVLPRVFNPLALELDI